jgi:hypothetical protein
MLKDLKKTVGMRPFKAIIYGTPKIGKSTFAASAPEPLFINIDDGLDGIDCVKYEFPNGRKVFLTALEVIVALTAVLKEEHTFKSLVIDALSSLERLIMKQVNVDVNHQENELKFGRGAVLAMQYWLQITSLLDKIRDQRKMIIILIGHEELKPVREPMSDPYDRYDLKLSKDPKNYLTEWADMILFADQEVFVTSVEAGYKKKLNKGTAGNRYIYTVEDPKYLAGNRYGLPGKLPLNWLRPGVQKLRRKPLTRSVRMSVWLH